MHYIQNDVEDKVNTVLKKKVPILADFIEKWSG